MFESYRVVAFTFVKRWSTLDLLAAHLERQAGVIDEWVLCWEGDDPAGERFVSALGDRLAPWTRVAVRSGPGGRSRFYDGFRDPQTIYVKLDVDVVWMEPDAVHGLVWFLTAHPAYSIASGNVVNNALVSHLHCRMGVIDPGAVCGWDPFDHAAWSDGPWAEQLHRQFLACLGQGLIGRWKFGKYRMFPGERFSTDCVAFAGRDMANLNMTGDDDDDAFLSQQLPRLTGRPAVWYGGVVFARYASPPQRAHLQGTDVLNLYRGLAPRPCWP